MNVVAILEGIISTVPAAIKLFNAIAPLLKENDDVDEATKSHINRLADEAHSVVSQRRDAIKTLVDTSWHD